MKHKAIFDNKKSQDKFYAVRAWGEGETIKSIAEQLGRSRQTIYRWIQSVEKKLGTNEKRSRMTMDEQTSHRIIELFILKSSPSLSELSRELQSLFSIRKTPAQLRYFLKRKGLLHYRPSAFFNSVMRAEFEKRSS